MSKTTKKQQKSQPKRKKEPKNQQVNVVLPDHLSADQMREIIADAIMLAEEKKQKEDLSFYKPLDDKELKEWQDDIGYKDYSKEKLPFRWIKGFLNMIWVFIRFNLYPKEKIKDDVAIVSIQKMVLSSFFDLLRYCFLAAPVVFSVYIVFIDKMSGVFNTIGSVLIMAACLIPIGALLGGFFRMASIEVERMEDKNFLFSISAYVVALVALVVSILK